MKLKKLSSTLKYLHYGNTLRSGINFGLCMEDDGFIIYDRQNQPCQGGELRKYKTTHPGDCTRPDDFRPTDLKHPFPNGIPRYVAVGWSNYLCGNNRYGGTQLSNTDRERYDQLFLDLIEDNPWGIDDVEITTDINGYIIGLLIKDLTVDSTTLVSFLKFCLHIVGNVEYTKRYDLYKSHGFSTAEAILCLYQLGITDLTKPFRLSPSYNQGPVKINIWRFLNHKPHDLTGGSFEDRYDYNRPELVNVFQARDTEVGHNLLQEVSGALGSMGSPPEKFIPVLKDILDTHRTKKNEGPTVITGLKEE